MTGENPADRMDRPGSEDGLQVSRRAELLRRHGFRQTHVVDPSTGHAAWMWAKVWRGVRDAVIATADGALAYRAWDADFDPRTPFVVESDIRLWSAVGNFLAVSTRLLDLDPPPGRSHFPNRTTQRA